MRDYETLKKIVFEKIDEYHEAAVALADDLTDNPEVSGEEYRSSSKIVNFMLKQGYEAEYPFSGIETAFRMKSGEGGHSRRIAILSEYDALAELGHACGHSVSGSISVLAALALNELQDELDCDIDLIGTPNEEFDGAKGYMADNGVFDEYDMATMLHLYNENVPVPKLQTLATFTYRFHGVSAHAGSSPWEGQNALNGVTLFFHAIDMLRQHLEDGTRIHGIIKRGGDAPNAVPDETEATVYVRSNRRSYMKKVCDYVDDCARGAAIATQTTWDKFEYMPNYDLKENLTGNIILNEVYEELGLKVYGNNVQFAASDIGNVSYACPAFQPLLKVVDSNVMLHSREMEAAMKTDSVHESMKTGAGILCLEILRLLTDERSWNAMKEDFRKE